MKQGKTSTLQAEKTEAKISSSKIILLFFQNASTASSGPEKRWSLRLFLTYGMYGINKKYVVGNSGL